MKKAHLALSLLSLSFLAACGGAAAASAAGVYEVDKTAFKAAVLAAMPAEARKEPKAMEMFEAMINDMVMTVELKADGSVSIHNKVSMMGQTKDETSTGTWKLDGGKLTVQSKDKDGKEETKTVDYANGSFSFEQEENGMKLKMTFKRK